MQSVAKRRRRHTQPRSSEVGALFHNALSCISSASGFWVDRRQTAPYSPAPDSDHVLIEPRLRHRTPSAWMSFALGAA